MMRVSGVRMIAPMLTFALASCGAAQAETQAHPLAARVSASPSPSPSPSPTPTPHVVIDAAYLASELGGVEDAIRMADTAGDEYASLGDRQQHGYQLLAAHPDWVPAVLNAVSPTARSAIQDNLGAAQQIDSLNGSRSSLPHWLIIAPPAPEVLPRRQQFDRDQHGPHPRTELGGGAGTDAVHAGDLGQLRPRRRQQSA